MTRYFIGVDLGQQRDPSTIAVVERAELRGAWDPAMVAYRKEIELRLRVLERLPLRTPYPDVVSRVLAVAEKLAARGRAHLIVDGTGVGRPVVDLLIQAHPTGLLKPVLVTAGDKQTQSDGYYHVPKRDLIIGLQVLFQSGTLRIAQNLAEGETLARELMDVEVRVSSSGREQMAAWREGLHDDPVFAVALSCWGAKEAYLYPEKYWVNRREAEMADLFRGMGCWKRE